MNGKPQIRQSAGKKVKNKVAAARLAKPPNLCSAKPRSANPGLARLWSAAWPWVARIRNPVLLLLKTASCTRQADRASPDYTSVSIDAVLAPMQRGYRSSNHLPVDSATAYAPAERVQTPESYARCSCGDSNDHSELFAAAITEAHTVRRNREAASDMLLVRHIPDSKILRKVGSKRARHG